MLERVARGLDCAADRAPAVAYPDPEDFRHKSRVLDEHCAAIGRDPGEIVRSKQILVNAADPSTPDTARQTVLELVEAGTTHLVLAPIPPLPSATWLAEQIAQPVLEQLAKG